VFRYFRPIVIFLGMILVVAFSLPTPAHVFGHQSRVDPSCKLSVPRAVSLPILVSVPDTYTANRPDKVTTQMKAWADYMMRLSSRAAVSMPARKQFKLALISAAESNTLQFPKGWDRGEHRPPSTVYHTMETL